MLWAKASSAPRRISPPRWRLSSAADLRRAPPGHSGSRSGRRGMAQAGAKYKRVLLKVSGEALMGPGDYGLHPATVDRIADEIRHVHQLGVQVCLVIGGGNIFRGVSGAAIGM